ncbi:hypothetical protein KEM52_002951 [Ascosphaera acerosa]|nr:hypothetical protein KEM52_002951 [Ascosphaera acerosa]
MLIAVGLFNMPDSAMGYIDTYAQHDQFFSITFNRQTGGWRNITDLHTLRAPSKLIGRKTALYTGDEREIVIKESFHMLAL